jgi:hypothetical protein
MSYIKSNLSKFIEPAYSMEHPNQKIILYKDKVQCFCEKDGRMHEFFGEVLIEYTWHPTLCTTFKIETDFIIMSPEKKEIHLKLRSSDEKIVGSIYNTKARFNSNSHCSISGKLSEKTYINRDNGDLNHIVFHVVNFTHFVGLETIICEETCEHRDRVVFIEGDWKIVIEQPASSKQSFEELNETGGHSITHVGRIQKINDDSFSINDVSEIIDTFSFFLSFIKGSRVPIILLVGYDKQGIKICEEWRNDLPSHSYQNRLSWMPNNDLSDLPSIFPHFICWLNEWDETAVVIINLYLEANYNNLMDVSIVVSCSVLEMLARVILVEERKKKTEREFDNMREYPSANKITDLLKEFSIPTDFPPSKADFIEDLIQFVKDNVPEEDLTRESATKALIVLTKIRNEITHSNKKYKGKLTPLLLSDAADLSLWYIEMTILARLNYNGIYKNRLNKNQQTENVPWYTLEGSSKSEV